MALIALSLQVATAPTARATWIDYQTSPTHSKAVASLPIKYAIQQVHFGTNDENPGLYYFYLNFLKPVTADLYAGSDGSYAAIQIDTNGDSKVDYELRTSTTPYLANVEHDGLFVEKTTNGDEITSKCAVQTFTDLTQVSDWIGFQFPKTCLSLPASIGVRGVSVFDPKGKNLVDLVPDAFWKLKIGASVTAAVTTLTPDAKVVPTLTVPILDPILSPDTPPTNLGSLAASVTKSVVTLTCGTGLGTGWALKVDLPTTLSAAGYTTYLITNQHVIKDCQKSRKVDVALPDQRHVDGYLWTWDEDLDVAGILLKTSLPGLDWTGSTPEQGWWDGIIGSPLGHPGILTEGIISSVEVSSFMATTTAHINPGNSGGPVFDRTGRVIGIATSKYLGSEGFGIAHGTPMICAVVVKCLTKDVWSEKTVANVVTPTQNMQQLVAAAKDLLAGSTDVLAQLDVELAKAVATYPNGAADLLKYKKLRPTAPTLTGDSTVDIEAISSFSDYVSSYHKLLDAKVSQIQAQYINVKQTPAPMSAFIAKKTITCVKGSTSKKVTEVNPKCPTGYTLKK